VTTAVVPGNGPKKGVSVVGEYKLQRMLGEGGMGVVYLARHRQTGARAALKILRPQVVGDREGRERLDREVSSLERVESRWIAEIVDADPWGDVPFVATRYVQGPSLHDLIADRGPMRPAELMRLAWGLAEGIAACHEVGVLHRDVKPSNVLMEESRTPILIDFGLARVADDTKITQTGWLLGTPGYLPPEILYGKDATPASDVHSWAATVAYAATGRPPFGRGPSAAVMDRARRGEFDLAGIAEPLRGVLAAALSVEPGERPTLRALLGWLRDPSSPPPGVGADAPTVPLTLMATASSTPDAADAVPAPPARAGFLEGARRVVGWAVLAALVVAGFASFPWVTSAVVLASVWLLRSGSMAVAAHAGRRAVRGARWHDGPRLVLSAPWHLVRWLPSTVGLGLWAAAAGVVAMFVCHLAHTRLGVALVVFGLAVALMLATGPGGAQVRWPVAAMERAVARHPRFWIVLMLLLAGAAAYLGWYAQTYGPSWTPFGAPFSWS
jgi:predicted Ser/Thr protein kinase